MSTKQCVVSENQFCLSISNKRCMRKTIISIIPIIESRTYSGSSEEASLFLALKGNYLPGCLFGPLCTHLFCGLLKVFIQDFQTLYVHLLYVVVRSGK